MCWRDAHCDITKERVTFDVYREVTPRGIDGGNIAVQMARAQSRELDMGAWRDIDIDISPERERLEHNLGGCALGVGEINGHVTEDRESHQLSLDVPLLGALTLVEPTSFEDRFESE